uniref:cDNA FLJ38235 fis, clone FCBBF2005428 n=1 Tax=Homo sapiens TaxID=9606 RepID=Q8N984_HUMAN|nr:unnamed protein product [Homo sapiens]
MNAVLNLFTSTNSLHLQSCLGVPCSEDTRHTRSDVRKQAVKISLCDWVTQTLPDKEEPILSVPGDLDLVDILQNGIWIHYNDDIMLTGQDDKRLLYTRGLGKTHALQKKNLLLITRICRLQGGRGRNTTGCLSNTTLE